VACSSSAHLNSNSAILGASKASTTLAIWAAGPIVSHRQPAAAADHRIAVYLGCIERANDRGGHTLYCSLVYIELDSVIGLVHR